ncbi:sulfatase [Rhabdobacter roseus]
MDDLRPELGCYGNTQIKSPHIDQLAHNGLTFNKAYCQLAICNPSRASVLTGLRPDSTKVFDLETHFREKVPNVVTLPQYFKQQGYFTASFSKVFHLRDEPSWSEPEWKAPAKPFNGYALPANVELNKQNGELFKNKVKNSKKYGPPTERADVPDEAFVDGATAQKAIETLRRVKDQPFFLAVGFYRPHLPFIAPQKYWDLYDPAKIQVPESFLPAEVPRETRDMINLGFGELRTYHNMPDTGKVTKEQAKELIHGYYASVSYVDAQVGKVLEELKRLGLEKNTVVVLWGDHGWKLGDYGAWSKRSTMEVDARVPLIMRMPGMKAKGKQSHSLVELVDLYPSLCEAAGLPLPTHVQGKSFTKMLNNPSLKTKAAAITQHDWPKHLMAYSMRTDRYRYTRWQQRKAPYEVVQVELYDHQHDPGEKRNVAASANYAEVLKKVELQYQKGQKAGFYF